MTRISPEEGSDVFHRYLAILGLTAFATAVHAQSPVPAEPGELLGEITVTATWRATDLRDVPASVTVLNQRALADAGVQHFQDVLGLVPNLNWAAGSSRPRYFQLRGVGDLEQYQGAPNPSIGFLIDDIDLSGVGMAATLFDVEQVEVLRGPQGTRYGANALGGLIKVNSRAPNREFEMLTEATAGQDDALGLGAVVGGAIAGTETGAFRAAIQKFESGGFRDNAFLGRDDTNGRDELTARARLHLEPAERVELGLSMLWIDLDNGYDAFAIDNSRVTQSDNPGRDAQRTLGGSFVARYDADRFAASSTTAYADSDIVFGFDGDWGNNDFWGVPYDFVSLFERDRSTFTEDLRFESPALDDDRSFAWIGGVYLRQLEETNDQFDQGVYLTDVTERTLASDFESTSYALYGQADWRVLPRLDLSLGLRLERREADYRDSEGAAFGPSDDMIGGHLTATVALSDTQLWYASLNRGYKSGGFNIGAAVSPERREYDPEFLWSLETGLRSSWLGGRLETGVNVFYMERRDQQVDTSFQLDPNDPLTFVFYTDNAAEGRNYGLEGSMRWRASDQILVEGSLGLLESYYIDYLFGERDLDGREQSYAPSYQYSLGATWRHPMGFMLRADVTGRDAFYYSASHDERARVATLVNLKAGYEADQWAVYLWGLNVFDEDVSQLGFFFGNEPPDFIPTRYTQAGDPRQIGVTAQWRF
jgi:outer membrane receptor protein involved in Fe transport